MKTFCGLCLLGSVSFNPPRGQLFTETKHLPLSLRLPRRELLYRTCRERALFGVTTVNVATTVHKCPLRDRHPLEKVQTTPLARGSGRTVRRTRDPPLRTFLASSTEVLLRRAPQASMSTVEEVVAFQPPPPGDRAAGGRPPSPGFRGPLVQDVGGGPAPHRGVERPCEVRGEWPEEVIRLLRSYHACLRGQGRERQHGHGCRRDAASSPTRRVLVRLRPCNREGECVT